MGTSYRAAKRTGRSHAFRVLAFLALTMLLLGGEAAGATEAGDHGVTSKLKVMTYNINHGAGKPCTPEIPIPIPLLPDCSVVKLQLAANVIRQVAPDVVGLQEVDRFWARSGYVDQALILATELGMAHCYGANLDHPPDSHSIVPHQYGTAILSRFPITKCANNKLPKASPNTEQRGLLSVSVRLQGTALPVFNTHLQHCSPIPANPCGPGNPDRIVQVQAIRDQIGTPDLAILLGDFNADPDWPESEPIRERFEDAWVAAGVGGPGNTHPAQLAGEPERRIDQIYFRGLKPNLTFVPVTLESRIASDHYPVVSESAIQ